MKRKMRSPTSTELMGKTLMGESITIDEILRTYADKNNWRKQFYRGKNIWVWKGRPFICPLDAARKGLEILNGENSKCEKGN